MCILKVNIVCFVHRFLKVNYSMCYAYFFRKLTTCRLNQIGKNIPKVNIPQKRALFDGKKCGSLLFLDNILIYVGV